MFVFKHQDSRQRPHQSLLIHAFAMLCVISCGQTPQSEDVSLNDEPSRPPAIEDIDLYDLVENGDFVAQGKPHLKPETRGLAIPAGSSVSLTLPVTSGATLMTRDTKIHGSATARLEVKCSSPEHASRLLTLDLSAEPDRSIDLQVEGKGEVTLVLTTIAPLGRPRASAVLVEPRLKFDTKPAGRGRSTPQIATPDRPNIIVYLVDALRRDRVGAYNPQSELTPSTDRFAESGLVFTNAQAQTSWTRPAIAALFTGLRGPRHGVVDKPDHLPDGARTLAELLSQHGYSTAAFVSNGNASHAYGFAQGFEYFKYIQFVDPPQPVARSSDVHESFAYWLRERRKGKEPFFAYIHTVDPHLPYAPPEVFRSRHASGVADPGIGETERFHKEIAQATGEISPQTIDDLSALYDAEVAANDASFGDLLELLKEQGIEDSTIVVFLSDHGEEFFDHHGWTHGNTLYSEVIDIPLIMRGPGIPHGRRDAIVEHVDLFATLLDLAGAEAIDDLDGQSFSALLEKSFSESWDNVAYLDLAIRDRWGLAVVTSDWKYLLRKTQKDPRRPELYNRITDREELENLIAARPEMAEMLSDNLATWSDNAQLVLEAQDPNPEVSADVEEQLKALGYVE